ncbi:4Fe-4S dicluster domain-containing protein [Clostridium bovifaecis]|uniref:4Fe-4S dicluster domain-containing protein n=1 Tax=Clostridium bovifaecis TaxID=2184719 RepID=A0A6I6FEG4_9CLOT|nr:4Fe-4S dicluster domain-containing protein [Clostridium bovifaecis]
MKKVTIVSNVNLDKCTGCKTCEKVCPVFTIKVENKKAVVDTDHCMGCANCEQRCPFHAIEMVKRDVPFEVGIDTSKFNQEEIRELCEKAHLNPEQVICYCIGTRAEEVAAAILDGAKTPEDVSAMTGARTGCTIECIQPILRSLQAAGHELVRNEKGWQWYGVTPTAWDLPEEVVKKYSSRGFYFEEDKELLDKIVHTRCEGGENHDA